MPVIDDRGRLFGKINLIDFALIVFALMLVPLGYGAYLLFRTPAPQLLGVSPNPLVFKKGEQRVRISGEHLRPFLRATIGKTDARGFLIESPTSAEVVFDEISPGTYDLALFDPSEEIARLPNALTIVPAPAPPVQFVGRFVGPNAADARLARGTMLGDPAHPMEILEVQTAVRGDRAATLRGSCEANSNPCVLAGTTVQAGKSIALRAAGRDDALSFTVDEIRADGAWLDVHVRLFGIAEVLDLMRVGDVDRFNDLEGTRGTGVKHGAVMESLEATQPADGVLMLNFSQGLADAGPFNGSVTSSGRLPLKMRMAVLRMPLTKTERAWKYRDEFVRAGSAIAFETTDYFVRGMVLRIIQPDAARGRTDQ